MSDFLALARSISTYSNYKIKIGCVIVRNGTPIALGCNRLASHPKYVAPKQATLHAEVNALLHARRNIIRGTVAYIYRETKNGQPALARPCANCMALLKEYGVKKIVYTVDKPPYYVVERL